MRILANENFPGEAIEALRSRGHDVAWVRTDAPGSSDEEVIARATREGRLLITFDKDFGALAFRSGLSAHPQGSFSSAFRRVLHRAWPRPRLPSSKDAQIGLAIFPWSVTTG